MNGARAIARSFSAALLALFVACGTAGAQVSPGPLAAPHASIDGPTQCLQCHAAGASRKGMDERCLACHTDIAWMKARNRGTHARFGPKDCASCHPDHGGRDFQMIVWDSGTPEKFDHRKTGYVLENKHAGLECKKCHAPANQKSGAAPLIKKKNKAASWLGLEQACASCHADPHHGQLGTDCAKCHTTADWKKAATAFDHARTTFPLTGEHAKVACAKCHESPAVAKERDPKGEVVPVWKPLPHGDCVACHKDPHAGRFPGACSKCHVTTGWKLIGGRTFNHDLTRYPLRGKHVSVSCNSCHDPRRGGEKPKFARCLDCHQDAHAGKAARLGQVVDCASCHTVDGFDRSSYTVTDHAGSKYPLQGDHARTDCAKCHRKLTDTPANRTAWGTSRVVMRPEFTRCAACHFDPHLGRFEPAGARPHKDGCITCHTMSSFQPSKYDGVMHADCVFPLHGAHMAIPCQRCHEELKAPATNFSLPADSTKIRPLHFDNPRRRCVDCHENPHGAQFGWRKDKGTCDGCHDDNAFVPAPKFVHNRDSRYKLDGAHAKAPCASCHVPHRDAAGRLVVTYRPTPSKCENCHTGGARDSSLTSPARSGRSSSALPPSARERLAVLGTREAEHGPSH